MKKIVVLTGAGISAESGIKTFRDQDGLWENHHVEDVATYEAYIRNPQLVHDFYNARRKQLFEKDVRPNEAHKALTKLYEHQGDQHFFLVTQNVDDLHERAGTPCLHMHGELLKVRCEICESIYEMKEQTSPNQQCATCNKVGSVRPHIVWFGEIPLQMELIYQHLRESDIFLSVGTSGNVYPAAQFVQEARRIGGAHCIEFNLEGTHIIRDFQEHHMGPAGLTLKEWVNNYLEKKF